MTGYKSKRDAALDEEGMYLVHQTESYADNLGKSIVALGKKTVKDIEQINAQPAQEPWRESASDYERGVIDGRQKQMQSSVDKAVNAMTQRTWVGLTDEELLQLSNKWRIIYGGHVDDFAKEIEAKLKEKNT